LAEVLLSLQYIFSRSLVFDKMRAVPGTVARGGVFLPELAIENPYGYPDWERTFILSEKVDSDYMEAVFTHLKQDIRDNLFEIAIPAKKILELDDRVTNGLSIPMSALEDALLLYEEVHQELPEYLPQFYSATATIINGNYIEPQINEVDDDEPPF
jgi:hypothetical protein